MGIGIGMGWRFIVLSLGLAVVSCGGGSKESKASAVDKYTRKGGAPSGKTTSKVVTLDTMSMKGIGPISSLTLGEVDPDMAAKGKGVFKMQCSACHKISKKFVGPALKGVTKRRSPEWIMNMILNPDVMVKEDPIAKALLAKYLSPMANQNLTEEEARQLLEYFRTN